MYFNLNYYYNFSCIQININIFFGNFHHYYHNGKVSLESSIYLQKFKIKIQCTYHLNVAKFNRMSFSFSKYVLNEFMSNCAYHIIINNIESLNK